MSDYLAIQEHYWAERAYDMTLGEVKPATIYLFLASTRLAIEHAEFDEESGKAQELKESYHSLAGLLERIAKAEERPTEEQAQKWASQIRFIFAMMPEGLKGYVSDAAQAILTFCEPSWIDVDSEIDRSQARSKQGQLLSFEKKRRERNEEKKT